MYLRRMAKLELDNSIADMIKKIETFANSEEVYQRMISEGQGIMKSAIESGARKHVRTGRMANSLNNTKPTKDKNGIGLVVLDLLELMEHT